MIENKKKTNLKIIRKRITRPGDKENEIKIHSEKVRNI